jgi:hypothetical protein
MTRLLALFSGSLSRFDTCELSVLRTFDNKLDHTIGFGKKRMVFTTAYIFTGMNSSTPLTQYNITCSRLFPTKKFYTKAFGN